MTTRKEMAQVPTAPGEGWHTEESQAVATAARLTPVADTLRALGIVIPA